MSDPCLGCGQPFPADGPCPNCLPLHIAAPAAPVEGSALELPQGDGVPLTPSSTTLEERGAGAKSLPGDPGAEPPVTLEAPPTTPPTVEEKPTPPAPASPVAVSPRAREFVAALVGEDDFPTGALSSLENGTAIVARAPTDAELDYLLASIYSTPSRARFRDVFVAGCVDPSVSVSFEREDPAVVVAREKLWRILRQLDDEIAQASAASQYTPKDFPGKRPAVEFAKKLIDLRSQLARYHAICYANTLQDSHERITNAVIRRAVHVARSAGITVNLQD